MAKKISSPPLVDPPPPEIKEWEGIISYAIALFARILALFPGTK